jgi:hypothetical protein
MPNDNTTCSEENAEDHWESLARDRGREIERLRDELTAANLNLATVTAERDRLQEVLAIP